MLQVENRRRYYRDLLNHFLADTQKNKTIIITSILCITVALIVMLGWVLNIPVLTKIVPGFVRMVFNTALCFVLFGSALLLTQYPKGRYKTVAFLVLSIIGTLIGLITFLEFVFHINAHIDELIITDKQPVPVKNIIRGRMAFNASVCFYILGLGIMMFLIKNKVITMIAQYLFHFVTLISAISLIGYLYGVSLFDSIFYVSSMATHTAVLMFLISIAASLQNPSVGATWLFTNNQIGNKLAKRISIITIAMVVLPALYRVQKLRFQLFKLEIWIPLLAVCFLLITIIVLWNTAVWLNKIDFKRSAAEKEVKRINADLEKRVEERTKAYQKSEEKYRSLIEHASDAIYLLDLNEHFTDVNESMCKMTGYSRNELLQMKAEEILDPEELNTLSSKNLHYSGQSVFRETRFMGKDNKTFPVEMSVKTSSENAVLVIARDISYRKKIEKELRDAELKFRTVTEKSMVGIYTLKSGEFTYVNPRFAEIFGYEPEELIGKNAIDTVIHESYRNIALENVRKRVSGETESINYDAKAVKKDGSTNWVELYGTNAIIGDEQIIIGSLIDITERKLAEELTLKEKVLSDTIINSLPGIFYLYDQEGNYLKWNKHFETVTGYSAKEIQKMSATDLIDENDRDRVTEAIQKVFVDGFATIEANGKMKDGSLIPYLLTGSPIFYEDKWCLLGIGIDISSRLKAENQLKLSEQKYKLLFESNPLPFWMTEKETQATIAVNDAAAKLYGYTKEELFNLDVKLLRERKALNVQLEGYKPDLENKTDTRIVTHVRKDGAVICVQIIENDIFFEGRAVRLSLILDITEKLKAQESLQMSEANLRTILRNTDIAYGLFDLELKILAFNEKAIEFANEHYQHTLLKGDSLHDFFPTKNASQFLTFVDEVLKGRNISFEIDYRQTDGKIYWYDVKLSPLTNDSGKTLGMQMALYDITERKNAEQDLKNAYERIQAHINRIKEMAWKQSHLIRSPLANLKGLADMLKSQPEDLVAMNHLQSELIRLDDIIHEMADEASAQDI